MRRSLVRRIRCIALLPCFAAASTTALVAQDPDPLSRLDPNSRFAIESILDSASAAGIPTRPLLSKTYLGISKHAEPRKIVSVVRQLYVSLRDARTALGASLSDAEWTAAASALQAGVPAPTLARFRSEKPGKPLARALVVLADLITRGVPVDVAASTMVQLWQRGAGDAELYGLWHDVEQDILSGANPGTALQQRARDFPDRSAGQLPSSSTRPPETQ